MDLLAILLLIAFIVAVIWGAVQLVFWLMILTVAYLCIKALCDYLKKAFWS